MQDSERDRLTVEVCEAVSAISPAGSHLATTAARLRELVGKEVPAGDYMKEAERLADAYAVAYMDFVRCGKSCHEEARAALLAHIQRGCYPQAEIMDNNGRGAVPEGWQLVPKAPTEEMLLSGTGDDWPEDVYLCDAYELMLSAAPAPDHFRDATEMVTTVPEGWSLDESAASLLHYLTSPDDEGVHSPITLRAGNVRMDDGTVKFGLLCEYTDYPDEGATLLVEGQPTVAAPAPAATGHAEADRIVARLMSSDPDFQDCADAAALIQREIRGPDGFATWRDAAIAERLKRIASAPTAPAEVPMPEPDRMRTGTDGELYGDWTEYQMIHYGDAREAAGYAAGYAAGVAAVGWRDVADELPKEAQEVLFVRGGKTIHGAWIGGIFWHNNQKMAAAKWMPLPAPQTEAALRGEVK